MNNTFANQWKKHRICFWVFAYVKVTIYGSTDGRSVATTTETLSAYAYQVTRVITADDGTVIAEESFASYYEG